MNKDIGEFIHGSHARTLQVPPIRPETSEPPRPFGRQSFLNVLNRRLRLVVLVTVVGTGLVGIGAFITAPTFTATAQIMVEPTPSEVAAALIAPVIDTHITMLTSDIRLRRVIAELESPAAPTAPSGDAPVPLDARIRGFLLDLAARVKAAIPTASPAPAGPPAPSMGLGELKEALQVRQERLSSIIAVSVKDRSPERAAALANRLVQMHIEDLRGRKRRDAEAVRSTLDERVAEMQAEVKDAEDAVKAFSAQNGGSTREGLGEGEALADIVRQLGVTRSNLAGRLARLEAMPPPTASQRTAPEAERFLANARLDLEREIETFRQRERTLGERLRELQQSSGLVLGQQLERQALEIHVASTRKLLDDLLLRRQEEPKETARPFAAAARIFALASAPMRPSSIPPFLLLAPGLVAFCVLGASLALLLDRLDRSFRSERDAEQTLGLPCVGLIAPLPLWRRLFAGGRPSARTGTPSTDALTSVVLTTLHLSGGRQDQRILLFTAAGCDTDKAAFAAQFASRADRIGRRVLLVDWTSSSVPRSTVASDEPAPDGQAADPIVRDSALRLDRLTSGEASRALIESLIDGRPSDFLRSLRTRYNCLVIDAPPCLRSAEVRLLAPQVDGVLLAVRWGVTRREEALNALHMLRRTAMLAGDPPVNGLAVLTAVALRAHARFRFGDSGESLVRHRFRR